MSSQPVRRARPVVVPNSPPRRRISSPTSSSSSVGNGPEPTRVDVRLGDAPDLVDVLRPDAGADARRAGGRVGRGDERIRAVVDVQQRALGALVEHELVGVQRVPHDPRGVGDVALEPVAVGQVGLGHRLQVQRRVLDVRAQAEALGIDRRGDLLLEDLLVEQVLHADAQARGLVGVAGADAAPRRADLQLAELRLAGGVEQQVVGHDHVRVGRDPQAAGVDLARAQRVELVGQHARVDDDPVADDAALAGIEDPRRDQVELEDLAVADDRVAGVVAALEADDRVGALGEQIDDLPLAFVAPLGADDADSRHTYEEFRPLLMQTAVRPFARRARSGARRGRTAAAARTSPPAARPCAR